MYESMSSKGKLKESLKRGGNSVRHQRTPKSGDIESQPSSMTPKTSFAKEVFAQLLKTIQQKRNHVDSEKRVVYTKLMDHLDAVEVGHSPSTVVLVSIELLVFLGLLAALVCSLTLAWVKHRSFLGMPMWEYVALLMMIASGLSVVRFLTFVASWPVLRWWRIHKYAVFFIRRQKRCVDVALWFSIILLGWYVWFRRRLRHVHNELSEVLSYHVTRFLISLSLGSFLWVCKNALYLKLEADLHYDQLFDRIRQSVLYLHGLQIIHTRGMWKFLPDNKTKRKLMEIMTNSTPSLYGQSEGANHARDEKIQMKGENIWMLVLLMEKESAPVWILRRLAEEYLDQVKLRPLPGSSRITKDEQKILMEATKLFRQLVVKRIHDHEEPDNDISDHEIKRDDLKDYGLPDKELDFIFRPTKQEEVEEEEEDGERGGGGDEIISNSTPKERTIGYDEFMNQAVRAYKNCWGLERTLRSSKKVFIKLNRLLCTFLLMVVLIVWLLLSQIVDSGQLALLFTPFLAATFIFGESCREMFEGLIFAFAMHPFDVGDRVIIDNVQMRVTKLNILTSVFYKYDTGEEVITPNSKLTTTSIINLDITPDQSDKVEFTIAADTPLEDMTDLEIKVKKFMDDDIKFSSNNKVVKSEVVKDEVKMTVYLKYLVSYLSSESKAVHKSNILTRIMEFQKDMKKNSKKDVCFREPYYTLDITLSRKVKLKHIQDLEAQILRGVKPRYTPSKVVAKEVKKSQVKMGLYLTYPDDATEDVQRSDKQDESESEPLNTLMKTTIMEIEKNLYSISEKLKTNKFVTKLQILGSLTNSKDYVIIAQGDIGWDSLEARDVVHTKDHSIPSLETMPSGIGCSSSSERSNT